MSSRLRGGTPSDPEEAPKASIWHRLYHGETAFNFVGRARLWFALSGVVIAIGIVSLVTQGLNLGIDFEGGTAYQVATKDVSVAQVRDALRPRGLGDAKIQVLGSGDNRNLRVQTPQGDGTTQEVQQSQDGVKQALAGLARIDANQVSVDDVGPSFGAGVTRKAIQALVVFFIAITIYISFRFEWKMAVAALVAVVHDVLVTVGVYSLSRFEVTPATVVAFLTILGYSLYDTIVVFDKVEENTRGLSATGRMTYGDTVNLSMNQVLMRSLNTSLVAILPILSVLVIGALILGATTLQDFGLALLVGLLTGAYSSIYIASPVLALLKEREPRYAQIRQKLAGKGVGAPLTPAAAAAMSGAGGGGGGRSRGAGEREEAPSGPLKPGAATTTKARPSGSGGSAARSGASGKRTVPVQRQRPAGRTGPKKKGKGKGKGKRR